MELVFVIFLDKANRGRKIWLLFSIVAILISIFLLSKVTQVLPLGVTYAIWTGIGAILSVSYGIIALGEPKNSKKFLFIGCILVGIVGLNLFH